MSPNPSEVATARRFTRFFTRQTELLDESVLASRFSLSEARVLYELAHREGATASGLARALGMDAGYMSRIMKRFAADGLLSRTASSADGRQSTLALTAAGRAVFAPLEARSQEQWSRCLSRLDEGARREVSTAMATIERLLGAGLATQDGEVSLRQHRIGDLGWIARRQGMLYAAEYGWDGSFEALVAEILVGFVRSHDPVRERGWIAERDGAVLGSVFLMRASDEVAKLRLLYVEPDARGLGLGARLVAECTAFARTAGYRTLTLWTNDILVAARRIYLNEGFELVAEDRHRSFGVDLVGQNWSLTL